jgi:hypothetical protein
MGTSAEKSTKPRSTATRAPGETFFRKAHGQAFFAPVARSAAPGAAVQAKLSVSKPGDALEKEADRTAEQVMRMAVPATSPAGGRPAAGDERKLARAAARGAPDADPAAAASVEAAATGGQPLPEDVRAFMEPRLRADLSAVRVHSDATAARLSNQLSARAFTYRNHVFFGPGQYRPGTREGMALLAHELTHTIQQGRVPAVPRTGVTTTTATTPAVQRLGLDDVLDYFAEKAYNIPGFRMLTLLLGFNPVNMRKADRTAANLLRAIIELVPGGALITRVLDSHGVIDKAAAWLEQKLETLGDIGAQILDGLERFIDSLGWDDIFDLGDVWARAKRIFTDPIDRLVTFGESVVSEILQMVKDAILRPLAALAEGTRGYDLLKAILEQDPITGEHFPRTAETLLGGFMKLIGQEEVWEDLKTGRAVPRAWAWFQGALRDLMAFVAAVPRRIVATLRSLTFADVVTVVGAFRKVGSAFLDIAGQFVSWGLKQVLSLLEILFSVVAPRVMPYVAKARTAFQTIVRDPVRFVGRLVRAGRLGFQMFAKNIVVHLQNALIRWITGPLGEAGVYIPRAFTLLEIVKLVLSVLGLTWQNIRTKLLKIIPEPVLAGLERTASVLMTLVTQGPAAAWEEIKTELTELKDQLIGQVTQMISTEVVKAAVAKLVSMLNPAGAVIQAIIATYNTVTFFVQKIQQIGAVVASFIDSIAAIAAGQVEGAARRVELTMANSLTLIIAFLAKFAGLGSVPEKLVGIVKKVRAPIDKGLDRIVAWLGAMLQRLIAAAKAGAQKLLQWWRKKLPISGDDEEHVLTFEGSDASAVLVVRSAPEKPSVFLNTTGAKKRKSAAERDAPVQETVKQEDAIFVLQGELRKIDDNLQKAAGGAKAKDADAAVGTLDKKLVKLTGHLGKTLTGWGVAGGTIDKEDDIAIERKENFTVPEKRALAEAHFRRLFPNATVIDFTQQSDVVRDSKGRWVNLAEIKSLVRRHVVSSDDMIKHYKKALTKKTFVAAKMLIEQRGSIPEARTPVPSPLGMDAIVAAARKRYEKFFGYTQNLFIGDSLQNSRIQEALDQFHPDMAGSKLKLNNHVRRIARSWALDDDFDPTPAKQV